MASSTPESVCSVNDATRIKATSPSARDLTERIRITSRIIATSKGCSTPPRCTVITISELTGPRMRSTASPRVKPKTCSPSMPIIKSPDCIPALCAGVSSIGDTTFTKPFSIVTSIPSPPNSPRVCTCISPYAFGLRNDEWGSSELSIP